MSHVDTSTVYGESAEPRGALWPRIIGIIGIVVGICTIIDQLGDLAVPFYWTEDYLSRWFSSEMAQLLMVILPPTPWLVISALIGLALGGLLIVASLRLKNHVRSGVGLSTTWAWLVIAWIVLESVFATGRMITSADQLGALWPGGWQAATAVGLPLALAATLAYPAFLIYWFRRDDVRKEYDGWSSTSA